MKLSEILKFSDVDTKLDYHKSLNSYLWDGDVLKGDIKQALNKIAAKFEEYLDTNVMPVVDVIITGSNCNYNYTNLSDIDLHLVIDTTKLEGNPLTEPFLLAKKSLWNSGHDITVKGYTVELYAQDTNDKLAATGIYSLMQDKWLVKPDYLELDVDNFSVQAKAADMMNQIDDIIDNKVDNVDQINELKDKIRKMRAAGLSTGGEFSVENLAFKAIRNNGYFEKLNDYQKHLEDNDLSLESVSLLKTFLKNA